MVTEEEKGEGGPAKSRLPKDVALRALAPAGYAALLMTGLLKEVPVEAWAIGLMAAFTCYMGYTGMDRALYTCVCKETDEIFTAWIHFDEVEFARLKARAERVIRAAEPPAKCSNDPSWYVCKMCDFHDHCHGEAAPQVNCRTCAHSTPEIDGDARWSCQQHSRDMTLQAQRTGCDQHRYIPVLLQNFATQKDYVNGDVVYTTETGEFSNGSPANGALASQEIRDCAQKVMLADAYRIKCDLIGMGIDSKVVA